MPESLEDQLQKERLLKFQDDLFGLLEKKPKLYRPPHKFFIPVQSDFYSDQSSELEQKGGIISEIIRLGLFLYGIYNHRLVDMTLQSNSVKKSLDRNYVALTPETMPDLRDKYIPSFDDNAKGEQFTGKKLDELMESLQKEGWFSEGILAGNRDWAKKLIELTGRYDQYVALPPVSSNWEKSGGRLDLLEASNFYQIFVGRTSKLGIFKRAMESGGLAAAQERLGKSALELSREIIYAMEKMAETGQKKAPKPKNDKTNQLLDYLSALEKEVQPATENIRFNKDWKQNYFTEILVCIFNRLDPATGAPMEKINAMYSLLYTLDPTCSLLFFSSNRQENQGCQNNLPRQDHPRRQDNSAQAAAILFEVEDKNHQKYLGLEGLVMNTEFMSLVPLPQKKYPVFNKKLNRSQRRPYLDQILYHVTEYALSRNLPLFINMNEVTQATEYGPHELLYYLNELFPGSNYRHEMSLQDVRGRKMELAVSVSGGEELYLKKDNEPLLRILQENQIEIPLEMLTPSGGLKLLNHTWADPTGIEETGCNECWGTARGLVISLERIRELR